MRRPNIAFLVAFFALLYWFDLVGVFGAIVAGSIALAFGVEYVVNIF
jgi:hypothetical protein